MSDIKKVLDSIKRDVRLPTREEAAEAAAILRLCNGADLDAWSDGIWPNEDSDDALRLLSKSI